MSDIKLIYFEGCPNSKHARATLLTAGVVFEAVKQNELSEDNPLKLYSSPTILKGDQIIYGAKHPTASLACSSEKFDENRVKRMISGEKASNIGRQKSLFATIGSFGSSTVVGLCPVCIPAIGAFLSSVGLGFMASESVLKPLLILLLGVAVFGFAWSYRKEHKKIGPLALGVSMAVAMYIGRYIYVGPSLNMILMYGGIAGMIGASVWNLLLRKKAGCNSCK